MTIDKPIVAFDVESTGLDTSKDFIIQLSMVKFNYIDDTVQIVDTYSTYVKPAGSYQIGLGAYFKHKITPKILEDKPLFIDIAQDVRNFMDGCALLTYNGISFDTKILEKEFKDCGIDWSVLDYDNYDAFLEEKRRNGNRLEEVYTRLTGHTMGEAGLSAHDALSDVKATIEVFSIQQKEKEYLPEPIITEGNTIVQKKFDNTDNMYYCMTFGKYKDVPLEYVAKFDRGYIAWALSDKASFGPKTKEIIAKYL